MFNLYIIGVIKIKKRIIKKDNKKFTAAYLLIADRHNEIAIIPIPKKNIALHEIMNVITLKYMSSITDNGMNIVKNKIKVHAIINEKNLPSTIVLMFIGNRSKSLSVFCFLSSVHIFIVNIGMIIVQIIGKFKKKLLKSDEFLFSQILPPIKKSPEDRIKNKVIQYKYELVNNCFNSFFVKV